MKEKKPTQLEISYVPRRFYNWAANTELGSRAKSKAPICKNIALKYKKNITKCLTSPSWWPMSTEDTLVT